MRARAGIPEVDGSLDQLSGGRQGFEEGVGGVGVEVGDHGRPEGIL